MILLRTTDANLDGALVENALLFVALKIGRALAEITCEERVLKNS